MTKCFCCNREAIVLANTCSPTSVSGMTTPKNWCAYCLLSITGGANIFKWLVPIGEVKKAIVAAIKYAGTRIQKDVNVAQNRQVRAKGQALLKARVEIEIKREFRRKIVEKFNVALELKIEQTEANQKKLVDLVFEIGSENLDELIDGSDYGYCPDCEQRMPDEPQRDESHD